MNPAETLSSLAVHSHRCRCRPHPRRSILTGSSSRCCFPGRCAIAIYDRVGLPLWFSDGCDGPDLHDAGRARNRHGGRYPESAEASGFARTLDGTAAYVCILRDESRQILGLAALSCRESASGEQRPFHADSGTAAAGARDPRPRTRQPGQHSGPAGALGVRDQDLELLLGTAGSARPRCRRSRPAGPALRCPSRLFAWRAC